ncbi:MAG: DUF4962 domain-containing protein [Planctomycetota bacterium]|jgi:hypothetical protein
MVNMKLRKEKVLFKLVVVLLLTSSLAAAELKLDERPAVGGEWGYRPSEGTVSGVNPPSFSWRPQKGLTWEVECQDTKLKQNVYGVRNVEFNVCCPPKSFKPGTYMWRYRGKDERGRYTNFSKVRTFTIAQDAAIMPMPEREELLSRIPKTHPRLFVHPENLPRLRKMAQGQMKSQYDRLVRECDRLLKNPPPTKEPPKYPKDMVRGSEKWRKVWWGNRTYTIKALNGAAMLAFTRLLGGPEKYGAEAKRILLECAKWEPKGSTGYRYNDEAGMPYAYYFSRTYTFVNDLLNEKEKKMCRDVMKIRGDEMSNHLCPRHLWRPYSSHSNRAWHFLGEVGIAFLGEVEGADDWVWFAMNVFYNVYPVWCDDDGGWHEGISYGHSYLGRFTWWADVMREAMGVDAYDKPFFSKAGYHTMYLMPPGKKGGGFGDGAWRRSGTSNVSLMSQFAAQAGNGHWQWYVEEMGGAREIGGYIGFIRGALPKVEAKQPDGLPSSRLFKGIGQAYLNSDLTDASKSVQVIFKSSPYGTQSHGNEANNSFVLWAYGKQLLVRSGHYDSYGSAHHSNWVWSTRSVNNIMVNGRGQRKRTANARGEIVAFKTTPSMDIVVGEAGAAYETPLERFTRAIIFVKPELVVIYDRLEAKESSTFEYWLHAFNKINVKNQHEVQVRNDNVVCDVDFLTPSGLTFKQTNEYDPKPRPRFKMKEWHLTAETADKKRRMEFVTVYRPHRAGAKVPSEASLEQIKGGYTLKVKLSDGNFEALLPTGDFTTLRAFGLTTRGAIKCRLKRDGKSAEILGLEK